MKHMCPFAYRRDSLGRGERGDGVGHPSMAATKLLVVDNRGRVRSIDGGGRRVSRVGSSNGGGDGGGVVGPLRRRVRHHLFLIIVARLAVVVVVAPLVSEGVEAREEPAQLVPDDVEGKEAAVLVLLGRGEGYV